jgi:hypothetical protein
MNYMPELRSDIGSIVALLLLNQGFPPHRIEALFDCDFQNSFLKDEFCNPDAEQLPAPTFETKRALSLVLLLYSLGFPAHRIAVLFDTDDDLVSQMIDSGPVLTSRGRSRTTLVPRTSSH